MTVNTTTARADIYKEVYALLITSLSTPGVTISDSFSDDIADSLHIVINPPILPRVKKGFGLYDRSGSIELEIFAPTLQAIVELHDDIENTIFSNLSSLSVQAVEMGTSSPAEIQVGGKYIHTVIIPISFVFIR